MAGAEQTRGVTQQGLSVASHGAFQPAEAGSTASKGTATAWADLQSNRATVITVQD